jgi:hypothetical protein
MKAKVLKQIISGGKKLTIGDIVEVSSWKNIKSLTNTRYIELIEESQVEVKTPEVKKVVKKAVAKKAVAKK